MELREEGVGAIVPPLSSSQSTSPKVLRGQSGFGMGSGWSLGGLRGKFCFLPGLEEVKEEGKVIPLGERK